ncbi:hypothetical protein RvY_14560-1 [Ramazzottius varieornatus]|uniref:Uncharacterized protein n=1 Tax=Ramazzottius varieornatus TaxID=947166 RepID=A0A1D1VRQ7_RAMVA|nr:hypothetical protein RvY_14560-1 [Ramazzottius varieornatus]
MKRPEIFLSTCWTLRVSSTVLMTSILPAKSQLPFVSLTELSLSSMPSAVCAGKPRLLRQAIAERIKPILFINRIDRAVLELKLPQEDLYQIFVRISESTNLIATRSNELGPMDDTMIDPLKGNCGFGSGLTAGLSP